MEKLASKYNSLIHREFPPPVASCRNNKHYSPQHHYHALLHQALTCCGRAFPCLLFLLSLSFTFGSCSKEVMRYAEIRQYHAESLTLHAVTTDSVTRFSEKVNFFVAQHPAAKEDPLYPEIQQNISQSLLRITLTINDEWAGKEYINF